MKKILLFAVALVLAIGLMGCGEKAPAEPTIPEAPKDLTGFMIRIPEDVKISFYKDFEQKIAFRLPEPEVKDGYKTYAIPDMKPGLYAYELTGTGRYDICKTLILNASDLANGYYIYDDPGKVIPGGYQQTKPVVTDSQKIMETALKSDPSMFPDYADVFTVPTFLNMKREEGSLQATTQEQMEAYIDDAVNASKNAYRFSAGTSKVNSFDIPLVLFSKIDLSSAKSYKEAAELLKESTLPTVFYAAGIHGNEPAGKDGALAIINRLSGAYGEGLLDKMNILVVPSQNPDGAKDYIRQASATNQDLNRDHMKGENKEVLALHELFYTFLPEVFLDGHEFNDSKVTGTGQTSYYDALIATGGTANTSPELLKAGVEILDQMEKRVVDNGLSVRYYPRSRSNYNTVNSQNPTTGRSYYSLTGSLAFLVETRGIYFGLNYYERRVITQVLCVEAMLDYVKEHSSEVKELVKEERAWLSTRAEQADKGIFVLETDRDNTEYPQTVAYYDQETGERLPDKTYLNYQTTRPVQSVPLAGAYVIPASAPRIREILEVMDFHTIRYEKAEAGTTFSLAQIKKDAVGSYTETADVTFEDGAYIFPMNQLSSNILALLMEPICPDAIDYTCSLFDMGLVTANDDLLPVYRSAEVIPLGN